MKNKSNKWIAFDVDTDHTMKSTEPSVRDTERKTEALKRPSKTHNTQTDFNLIEKLKPKTVEALAVHSKKVKEVSDWLSHNVLRKARPSVLILTGPTGAGKTATLNVLCKSLNINLREWINPIDQDVEEGFRQSQLSSFLEFFNQAKYGSLCDSLDLKQVVLVEDFPNFIVNNPAEFVDVVLEKCLGKLSVVFICTDASSSKLDLAQTLFPQEIRDKYRIETISFNPVSVTLIKAALKRAQGIVQKQPDLFRVPTTEVLEAVTISAMGDIRSAMNQFTFACLKGVSGIPLDSSTTIPKKRKRGEKKAVIKSMEKDETLGFFHALGRVLNPKRDDTDKLSKISCDFDSLIDQFSIQPSNFNSFLQENYLKYFGNFEDVQQASDILSLGQLFLSNWNERHEIMLYSLWIAVLGLMVHNRQKVSKWNQIKAPTKIKQSTTLSLEDYDIKKMESFYYNKITKSNKFHVFKL